MALVINRVFLFFIHVEKGFLPQNIVGAQYIACTHWPNIVGAQAPTEPMVPTPMMSAVSLR